MLFNGAAWLQRRKCPFCNKILSGPWGAKEIYDCIHIYLRVKLACWKMLNISTSLFAFLVMQIFCNQHIFPNIIHSGISYDQFSWKFHHMTKACPRRHHILVWTPITWSWTSTSTCYHAPAITLFTWKENSMASSSPTIILLSEYQLMW